MIVLYSFSTSKANAFVRINSPLQFLNSLKYHLILIFLKDTHERD